MHYNFGLKMLKDGKSLASECLLPGGNFAITQRDNLLKIKIFSL